MMDLLKSMQHEINDLKARSRNGSKRRAEPRVRSSSRHSKEHRKDTDIQGEMKKMMDLLKSMQHEINDLKARSRNGSKRRAEPRVRSSSRHSKTRWSHGRSSSRRSRSKSPSRRSWADIMSDLSEKEQEPSTQSATGTLVSVSESTATTLHNNFTQPLKNRERLQIRNHYRLPKVPSTKTPQMEAFLKTPATKRADNELAKIHSYVLDAVAPLAAIIDKQVTEYVHPDVLTAVLSACLLLGNAGSKLAGLRRKEVMTSLDKGLLHLVKEDENFTKAAPGLFGAEFVETYKKTARSTSRSSLLKGKRAGRSGKKFFFRPPHREGGTGQSSMASSRT